MGASKTNQFTHEEINLSLIGRALAHPARIAILHHLKQVGYTRSLDLIPLLKLAPSTVHVHLLKLKDTSLVNIVYADHGCYYIYLQPGAMKRFYAFISNVTEND